MWTTKSGSGLTAAKICSLLVVFCVSHLAVLAASLEENFAQPPATTKPRCYWYWMDNRVTKDGITKDLEAMRQIGIGEAYIGIIGGQSGLPPVARPQALTDEWWSYVEHAIREGGRIGVDIGFFNSPGWSQSGGPWVKPSQAMRYVALPELRLHGPESFKGKLPVPVGEFQDLAVLAFPAPDQEAEVATISRRTATSLSFEMPSAFTARSLWVQPLQKLNVRAKLAASDDGTNYRTVKDFAVDRQNLAVNVGPVPLAPEVVSFPAVAARYFRLEFSSACDIGEVRLTAAALEEKFAEKSLLKMYPNPHPPYDAYTWPPQVEPDGPGLIIQPGTVRNLTKLISADGRLCWEVPAGDWIVQRAVMLPTGTSNSPATTEATGPEVDKMNRAALKAHFDRYVGELLRRMPASERTAWKHVVADSYEQGSENWTDGFGDDFQKRYGYDPLPWLPVMSGRIVSSAEQSDRFLWDLRRLVADRIAQDYVGGLRDLSHAAGMKMWLENYGHWGFPAEFLQYGGACDEIAGEFWANGNYDDENDFDYLGRIELSDAASAAHIYNMKQVWSEAFTGGPAFVNAPGDLKARGDWALSEGINQFMLHVYIHQPWDDKLPGINAWFGTEFNRHNTWFAQGKAWVDYLRRCTVMLQAGQPVADVAYFISEDTPKMAGQRNPELPAGRDFDYINAEVIEKNLTVKDGTLALPFGLNYRLMVLPEQPTMRPELLRKIRDLIKAGATVVGTPPSRSPSLENFPKCDEEVQTLATEIWGGTNVTAAGEHALGRGRVIWGKPFEEIFSAMSVRPDFQTSARLRFKHRQDGKTDIYFVANPATRPVTANVAFRVTGKAPELWWPDSGKRERPALFDEADGMTRLPLELGPNESVFVVFQKSSAGIPRLVSVRCDGREIIGTEFKPFQPAVAEAQPDRPNNFAFSLWLKPAAGTALVAEQESGVVMPTPRNEVFAPPHGNTFGGEDQAGCGLCAGTNGVCVLEHGANYFVPTLVCSVPLTNWTLVTVVYRHGQPSLYLNGALARTGLQSTHTVHSGAGSAAGESYAGELGEIKRFSTALTDEEIAVLAKATPRPATSPAAVLPVTFSRTVGGRISAQVREAGNYRLKFSNGAEQLLEVSAVPAPLKITGPWEVSFTPGWGAPEKMEFRKLVDWTTRREADIKYFSGQATYRQTLVIPPKLLAPDASLVLNLGEVRDLATVRVNGRELATLWTAPFKVDVTSALHAGRNTLEITVVNPWNNRLVGDAKLPAAQRHTFLSTASVKRTAKLKPAGLLGPVSVETILNVPVN